MCPSFQLVEQSNRSCGIKVISTDASLCKLRRRKWSILFVDAITSLVLKAITSLVLKEFRDCMTMCSLTPFLTLF